MTSQEFRQTHPADCTQWDAADIELYLELVDRELADKTTVWEEAA